MGEINWIWEERWHPLPEEWVIIAAHRQNRPWSGETLAHSEKKMPQYVADCYLCPGNPRVSGRRNPDYAEVFVFDNDHPCVDSDAPPQLANPAGIYKNRALDDIARVVYYSLKDNLTLAELEPPEVENLLTVWQGQYTDLAARLTINHVLIFENKGEAVGVSNPHPHCQIYATNFVFKTIETEAPASTNHFSVTGNYLFQDIISAEQTDGRRIISENETAIAYLTYFVRYAYEVYGIPKKTHPSLSSLSDREVADFAEVLRETLIRFDNLWHAVSICDAASLGADRRRKL